MLWIAAAAAALVGEPVYLVCQLREAESQVAVEISVNEAAQEAVISLPETQRVARRTAMISPTEVKIVDDEATWLVSRTSLTMQRLVQIGDKRWDDRGTCKVAPAPAKRAF